MIKPLPLRELDASLTLLLSCRCSSWCRSQREWSQSCRHDLWSLYVSSDPVGSLKHQGNSLHQKMWSSDKEPTESNKVREQKKVSCVMKTAGLLYMHVYKREEERDGWVMQDHVTSGSTVMFLADSYGHAFSPAHVHPRGLASIMSLSVLPLWGWSIRPPPSHPG